MVILGGTAPVGLAWLTALMTLIAGFPHLQCRCPGGQAGRSFPGLGDLNCCGVSRIWTADGPSGACCDDQLEAARVAGHGCHAGQAQGCLKTWSAPGAVAVPGTKAADGDDLVRKLHVPPGPVPGLSTLAQGTAWVTRLPDPSDPSGPPADLITWLCRLLI
jgi:hypothetical protein